MGCSTGTMTVVTVPRHGHNTIGYPLPEKAVAMKKWVGFWQNPTYLSDWIKSSKGNTYQVRRYLMSICQFVLYQIVPNCVLNSCTQLSPDTPSQHSTPSPIT